MTNTGICDRACPCEHRCERSAGHPGSDHLCNDCAPDPAPEPERREALSAEAAPAPDDREALADLASRAIAERGGWGEDAAAPYSVADAIIAAGFRRHPEPVNPTCEHGIALSDLCEYAVARAEVEYGPEPVKPSREDVARALDPAAFSDWSGAHDPRTQGDLEARRDHALRNADAVLALWPGRSVADVKVEALREFAEREWDNAHEIIGAPRDHYQGRMAVVEAARREADRIERGES